MKLTEYFYTKQRDGKAIYFLNKDTAPEWLWTALNDLHTDGDGSREHYHDWIYEVIYDVCGCLDADGEEFSPLDYAANKAEQAKTATLCDWLKEMRSSNLMHSVEESLGTKTMGTGIPTEDIRARYEAALYTIAFVVAGEWLAAQEEEKE